MPRHIGGVRHRTAVPMDAPTPTEIVMSVHGGMGKWLPHCYIQRILGSNSVQPYLA